MDALQLEQPWGNDLWGFLIGEVGTQMWSLDFGNQAYVMPERDMPSPLCHWFLTHVHGSIRYWRHQINLFSQNLCYIFCWRKESWRWALLETKEVCCASQCITQSLRFLPTSSNINYINSSKRMIPFYLASFITCKKWGVRLPLCPAGIAQTEHTPGPSQFFFLRSW